MAYKNININELGLKQRIVYKSSKVAFFVPRLLSKLATKLIINPITKLVSGEGFDTINAAATQVTMAMQNDMADEMQEKIDEGYENLENWENDQEYLIGDMAKYKAYNSYIEGLQMKQVKLRRSPKKLLIAQNYLKCMKQYRDLHKAEKRQAKEQAKAEKRQAELVKKVVEEYAVKQSEIKRKTEEVAALREALSRAQSELGSLSKENEQFESENKEIIEQVREMQPNNQEEELMAQMSLFADASEEKGKTM